jgi:4-amino-4-deoxy-L-arabinose transferase-like glycosyltransferase
VTHNPDELTGNQFDAFPWLLAIVVLVSRVLTTGPLYFIDGPEHVDAAVTGTYVVQPPGYWLFNRTIAFFPDPERGIVFLNWTFSVLGVVTFYYAARLLVQRRLARWGTAVYAALFYVWFIGGIHSTYASQLLFPVLVFLFIQLHSRQPRLVYLIGAAVAYAIGAGFRPTDGFFLGFMFLHYLVRHAPRRQALLSFSVATVLCLVWVVPTIQAFVASHAAGYAVEYSGKLTAQVSPAFHGITYRSLASVTRFVVPVTVAFWPLLVSVFRTLAKLREEPVKLLWIWIAPGAAFMLLFYMSHAPYVTFFTAAVVLLALKQLDSATPRVGTFLLAACLVSNIAFFMFFVPIRSKSLAVNIINVYAGKYTSFAIQNQWQPDLSDIINRDTLAPNR